MDNIKLKFDQAIIGKLSSDEVYARITKEELKSIYDSVNEIPCNDDYEEDENYIEGEIQFMFNPETEELEEIQIFPVYKSDEDEYVNGDFINYIPECIYDFEEVAKEYLREEKKRLNKE